MYRKKDRNTQLLFKELMPFGGKLNEDNRWVRLRELIPWEELEEEYQKYFSSRGRPGLDGQLVIGIICIKHMLKLSDQAVMEQVLENPYMQSFCGLESFASKRLFNESSLSKLRKRLGKEYFRKLERQVLKVLKEKKLIKARGLMVDATIFPSKIRYPTCLRAVRPHRQADIGLLNEVREWVVGNIIRIGKEVGKKVRTYRRKARGVYLGFSKRRKKTRKMVKNAKKAMLQYLRRNIGQLSELQEEFKKRGLKLRKEFVERFEVVRKIYRQQLQMYKEKTHRVKERIVSFHQPQVRPMVRGKAGKEVEFGPKGELSLIDGYLFVDNLSFNNFNESTKLKDSVRLYKYRFGKKPPEVITDRIYGTKENRQYLKVEEIKAALNPLGRRAQTEQAKKHRQWGKKRTLA